MSSKQCYGQAIEHMYILADVTLSIGYIHIARETR